ncbi:LamG-like jellyroll fold domain-containing protein [Planctomycetota bacterium]
MFNKSLFPTLIVLMLVSIGYAQETPKPIVHFEFKDANDFAPGTPQGDAQLIWDNERSSYVLRTDGVGAYIDTGTDWRELVAETMTVAAWIKTDSLGELDTIVALGYAWRLYVDYSLNIAFEVGGTQPTSKVIGSRNVSDGRWHHLVGTYDGLQLRLYVDGQLDAAVTATGPIPSGSGDFTTAMYGSIGALYKSNDGAPRNFFNGLIDDVRIYSQALYSYEVSDLIAVPEASQPIPADGQIDVAQDAPLAWKPGNYAAKHNVYLSTSLDELNAASVDNPTAALVSKGQTENHYRPEGKLTIGQTYYWRVDEVNAPPDNTVFPGPAWSFTVEPYSIHQDIVNVTASSSQPGFGPENTVNGSGLDQADQHGTAPETMWLSAAGDQDVWIQYTFDKAYKLDKMLVWNSNQVFEPAAGLGVQATTIEVSMNGADWTVLDNVPPFAKAPGTPDYTANTTVNLNGLMAQFVRLSISSGYGPFGQYGLSEVRFFYIPTYAREPMPANGEVVDSLEVDLSWRTGRDATSHEVYLGTDANNLILQGATAETTITLDTLYLGQMYYWQIVEINEAASPSQYAGDVWSFSTADAITVDDMEQYGSEEPIEIWRTWADGYFDSTNGSEVGTGENYLPETWIVHSGNKSLPLNYNNVTAAQSEATRTFATPMSWNGHGIQNLVFYIHGSADNTGGRLYIKINDTKIVYSGAPTALMDEMWTQWTIPLANVATDLNRVESLTLGIDNGGTGVIYIDDILLTH